MSGPARAQRNVQTTHTWLGAYSSPFSLFSFVQMAFLSSAVPVLAVYRVKPWRRAATPAWGAQHVSQAWTSSAPGCSETRTSTTAAGVSKSGSPAARPITWAGGARISRCSERQHLTRAARAA